MVSGLVTSPCDQLRIFSGEATLILMESKSATAFPRSNGLERYKVSSCSRLCCLSFALKQWEHLRQRPILFKIPDRVVLGPGFTISLPLLLPASWARS